MPNTQRGLWNWLSSQVTQKSNRTEHRTPAPSLEALEDRVVPSGAKLLDLTSHGASGAINGAIFRQGDLPASNAGALETFVRLDNNRCSHVEQGYNSDWRHKQFNEKRDPRVTHSLRLGDVRRVEVDGKFYREFVLDINQEKGRPLLSLDELRVYVGGKGNLHNYNNGNHKLGGLKAVYDLDAGKDRYIKLNSRLNPGSGSVDMVALIPESSFAGASDDSLVYLYSKFGKHHGANGSFEQWATRHDKTPPPPPPPVMGSFSGVVFNDLNNDGVWDSDEPVAGGFPVWVDLNGSGGIDEGEQDFDGTFRFDNLELGRTYTVVVERPDGESVVSEFTPTVDSPDVVQNFGVFVGGGGLA